MCCDGWDNYKEYEDKDVKQCPACGEDVDDEGYALSGCHYSPEVCGTCHSSPCDDSC